MGDIRALSPTAPTRVQRRGRVRRIFHFMRNCLAVIGLLFIIFHACFELSEILSPSMAPTLVGMEVGQQNDWVISEKLSYWFRSPRRFEIVRFRNNDGTDVMKRVAALPGERISLNDELFISINGQSLARPRGLEFLQYYGFAKLHQGKQCDCGPSGYFVLGDHARDSQDSRYEGPVERERIRARAWLIVWPPQRIGFVR